MASLVANQPILLDAEPPKKPLAQQAFGSWAATQRINPEADLRSQQITPGNDPRLSTTQGQTDTARNAVAGFSGYTPYQAPNTNDSYTQNASQYAGQAYGAIPGAALPGTDTTSAQRYLDMAGSAAGQMAGVSGQGVSYGGDTTSARGLLSSSLANLNGPDRSELAAKAFQLMQDQAAPARAQGFQDVGRRAAALGRIGAGMTTNDLTGLEQDYTRQDNLAKRDLALQAASQTLQDRLGVTGALQSGFGALAGTDQETARIGQSGAALGLQAQGNSINALRGLSDQALQLGGVARSDALGNADLGFRRAGAFSNLSDQAFGQGQSLRNENRADQGAVFDREQAGFSANRAQLGDLANLEGQQFGQNQSLRNELRGERGYQTDAARQAQQDRITQTMLEDQLLGSEFGRSMDQASLYDRLGNGYDPTGVLQGQAGMYGLQAQQGIAGVGDALAAYYANQGRQDALGDWVSQPTTPNVITPQYPGYQPSLRPAPTRIPLYGER